MSNIPSLKSVADAVLQQSGLQAKKVSPDYVGKTMRIKKQIPMQPPPLEQQHVQQPIQQQVQQQQQPLQQYVMPDFYEDSEMVNMNEPEYPPQYDEPIRQVNISHGRVNDPQYYVPPPTGRVSRQGRQPGSHFPRGYVRRSGGLSENDIKSINDILHNYFNQFQNSFDSRYGPSIEQIAELQQSIPQFQQYLANVMETKNKGKEVVKKEEEEEGEEEGEEEEEEKEKEEKKPEKRKRKIKKEIIPEPQQHLVMVRQGVWKKMFI